MHEQGESGAESGREGARVRSSAAQSIRTTLSLMTMECSAALSMTSLARPRCMCADRFTFFGLAYKIAVASRSKFAWASGPSVYSRCFIACPFFKGKHNLMSRDKTPKGIQDRRKVPPKNKGATKYQKQSIAKISSLVRWCPWDIFRFPDGCEFRAETICADIRHTPC